MAEKKTKFTYLMLGASSMLASEFTYSGVENGINDHEIKTITAILTLLVLKNYNADELDLSALRAVELTFLRMALEKRGIIVKVEKKLFLRPSVRRKEQQASTDKEMSDDYSMQFAALSAIDQDKLKDYTNYLANRIKHKEAWKDDSVVTKFTYTINQKRAKFEETEALRDQHMNEGIVGGEEIVLQSVVDEMPKQEPTPVEMKELDVLLENLQVFIQTESVADESLNAEGSL